MVSGTPNPGLRQLTTSPPPGPGQASRATEVTPGNYGRLIEEIRKKKRASKLAETLFELRSIAPPEVQAVLDALWENDDISELKELIRDKFQELESQLRYAHEWDASSLPTTDSVKIIRKCVDYILSSIERI